MRRARPRRTGTSFRIGLMLKYVPREIEMRTTIALDDDLLKKAEHYTGIKEKAALIREALTRLVRQEAARRLAAMGGSDPSAEAAPRKRVKA